ncbi:hypothetical protein QR680_013131 [Steinernema hermaphroditum]|uniref:ATP-dependent DNA helicase n=1 Tax=Steinernema hermaphroditum TaxID=289476 RepID=A0AA39I725_9BILA|nr:hypothetical protein QR680_013131 [Steinernema hermaphroditum]
MAATLLISGKTVHSAFKVAPNRPVPNYSANSEQGQKIAEADIIIWDEVTMSHRKLIDSIEQHCRDILPYDDPMKYRPFGGKVVLMSGDWKQLLPVVEGSTSPIEHLRASFKYSAHYDDFQKLHLTRNMRIGDAEANYRKYTEKVGTGYYELNDDGEYVRKRFVPIHKNNHFVEDAADLIEYIFPQELLDDSEQIDTLGGRAILAAHNENVDRINTEVLHRLQGESKIYEAIDEPTVDCPYTVPFLGPECFHHRTPSGMSKHFLELKEGAMVMLLRNLDVDASLCNGTKLIVVKMMDTGVLCKFVNRPTNGEKRIFIVPIYFKHVDKCGPTFSLNAASFPSASATQCPSTRPKVKP